MHVIRPVAIGDEEELFEVISQGGLGIISLPHDKKELFALIQLSISSFNKEVEEPDSEIYFFVLEDLFEGKIVGCCAIYARTALKESDDYFSIEKEIVNSPLPHQPKSQQMLVPKSYQRGPSILCSIYAAHPSRKEGLGKLLSLSRLLFIAYQPVRFTSTLIANIRGVINEKDESPFWQALGRHFFHVDFKTAMSLQETDRSFIKKIMPKHPVYTCLLPETARETLGKVHSNSEPALRMLVEQGFSFAGEVDPFDAGPKIYAEVTSLKTIKNSRYGKIKTIHTTMENTRSNLISNHRIDFRVCYGDIEFLEDDELAISQEVANALGVQIGDTLLYCSLTI